MVKLAAYQLVEDPWANSKPSEQQSWKGKLMKIEIDKVKETKKQNPFGFEREREFNQT